MAAVFTAAAVAFAPNAQADQWDYVTYLDNNGVHYDSVLDVLEVGSFTCKNLRRGNTVDEVRGALEQHLGFVPAESMYVVAGAVTYMCPDANTQ